MNIKEFKHFRTKAFIGGEWVDAINKKTFASLNPASNEIIAMIPDMDGHDAKKAITAAAKAFKTWSKTSVWERKQYFDKYVELLAKYENELAELMTIDQGKTFEQALDEVRDLGPRMQYDISLAQSITGRTHDGTDKKQYFNIRQPIGVSAGISPWNYPLGVTNKKISPALAAGSTVVIKPSETTSIVSLALASLWDEVGLPEGVVNMITTNNPSKIGDILTTDPRVKILAFTGSTAAGKMLAAQCMGTAKNVILEMGGNSPFVVFEDADLELAADTLTDFKLTNAGQICVCPNRIIVHKKVVEEFTEILKNKFSKLKMGDGMEKGVDYGPLNSQKHHKKVVETVNQMVAEGGHIVCGGKPGKQNFYPLTIIDNLDKNMPTAETEIFGPVAAIYTFENFEEMIDFANDTNYGLASYVFTKSIKKSWKFIKQIESGGVGVNQGDFVNINGYFGGYKESGIGRVGGNVGIENYLEHKNVGINLDVE